MGSKSVQLKLCLIAPSQNEGIAWENLTNRNLHSPQHKPAPFAACAAAASAAPTSLRCLFGGSSDQSLHMLLGNVSIVLVLSPKPAEFLSSRYGWVVTNQSVDITLVQSWLIEVQQSIWIAVYQ